ncbi:MAG: preprotein translocase subunit YajC, partial [Acutalibacteraceae bacterium]|nr:preprotein translocase subunit YajC [Acutalibacteraceae bacterium]
MNFVLLDAAKQPTGGLGETLIMLLPILLMFVVMYFIMIRPQRKKQKEEEAMKNNTQVGDEILSIGGIYGKIIAVKEDSFIIETGPDRSKIRLAKWGIQQNFT